MIADVMGVAPKTIVEWQEDGFPIALRGGPGVPSEYDSDDCIRWLVRREVLKVQGESPRDRVFRLQGDQLEAVLAKERGLLIPVDQVEPKWRAAVLAAREGLQRDRRRLAALLDGVTDRREREKIIGATHEAFLRRLSTWRREDDDIEAATE